LWPATDSVGVRHSEPFIVQVTIELNEYSHIAPAGTLSQVTETNVAIESLVSVLEFDRVLFGIVEDAVAATVAEPKCHPFTTDLPPSIMGDLLVKRICCTTPGIKQFCR
jgi:hypothetical protein